MQVKLLELMDEFGEVIGQLEEVKCVLQLQIKSVENGKKEDQLIRSVLKVHMRLLESVLADGYKLYDKMDGTFLEWNKQYLAISNKE